MNKYLPIAVAALLAFTGVAYAGTLGFSSSAKVTLGTSGQIALSSTVGTINGFSTHPPSSDPALVAYYQQLVATRATWQRTDLPWSSVQATSSASYVWGPYDTLVNEANAAGITTVFIIDSTPSWDDYSACSGGCAPAAASNAATFAAAAAAHFDGRVKYWEVWNEPNIATNFSGPAAIPAYYVSVLNASYSAIKGVDSSDVVLAGALARESDSGNATYAMTTFVTDMYADGAQFDALSLHPYSYPYSLSNTTIAQAMNGWQQLLAVRSTMVANGDTAKQIWVTEYGAPTCGPGTASGLNPSSFTNGTDYMTFEAQASLAQQVVSQLKTLPYVAHFFWYTLVDSNSGDTSDPENCFGAYYTNGTAKPMFWVVKNS